jgi:hypothetical protein
MHYFPTRAAFVTEAVRHVSTELVREMREQAPRGARRSERRRLEGALDEIWRVHRGPVFQAAMELWVAARTDPEVRAGLAEVARDINRMITGASAELFPELASKPGAGPLLDTALAAVRGLAMLEFHGDPHVERRWRATRAHLLELYERL